MSSAGYEDADPIETVKSYVRKRGVFKGEDASYPARELGSQGPAARGWRSAGPAPHELLLRLTSAAQLHRLQLLAHHQLIPSWVEVLVSGGLVSEGAATPCGATYSSVGKIALAKPTAQARTRELRSASLPEPTVARFVKLRLSGPHPPGNGDDQVALMAVNVLGEEVEESSAPAPDKDELVYSPYDDLAFVMYVENEIADLVRSLDGRKKTAVAEERFEYARRLKSAGAALTSAGIRVGRWQLRKRTAAARDEFELARRMRDRVADALMGIKEDSELCRLFEENGVDPRNDSSMPQDYDFSHHLSPSVACGMNLDVASPAPEQDDLEQDHEELVVDVPDARTPTPEPTILEDEIIQKVQEQKIEVIRNIDEEEIRRETPRDSPRRSITPNAANGGSMVRRRNKSAGPRSTFEAYEERLLPALRHSHTNEHLRSKEEESVQSGTSTQPPPRAHKLSERERKLLSLPILIFGQPLVEKFYSKNYMEKEEGLARLRAELMSPSDGTGKTSPNKTARAAAILLQRSLRDKVFSVYCQANDVVKTLFMEFMPDRVCAAEVGRCLEKLLPELLRACGDPAPRVHSTAQHTVLTVADCDHVRALHIIPQQLVRPVAASMHPRLALSRLQMLEQLLLTHGISTDKNSGLTVRRLAECGAMGAQHASGAVRAAAERVLLKAYERSPRVVRAQLPPDDAVTRRNLIYRHLFQQFDRIDMQKILNKAPSEDQVDQSENSILETASISQSTRSTLSGITSSMMTSSLGASSYSLKSMASSASGSTLAPSLSGSLTTSRSKSSLRRTPTKKYSPGRKDFSNIGYNKLRLDSAVSPKHSPNTPSSSEKVHFEDTRSEVVLRRTNRSSEKRHSMIHYDHDPSRPEVKNRPVTVYEPLQLDYDKNGLGGSMLSIDSPRGDFYRTLSKDEKYDYLESPKLASGLRSLQLEEAGQMEESGYYSPENVCEQTRVDVDTNQEPQATTCSWCGRRVLAASIEAHYWRRCVLLARCLQCRVTVEARSLHTHLLEECSMSEGLYKRCKKCSAALAFDEGEYHVNCIPVSLDEWKCPYCLINILARDLPWQRHLTQCSRNPRVGHNN